MDKQHLQKLIDTLKSGNYRPVTAQNCILTNQAKCFESSSK